MKTDKQRLFHTIKTGKTPGRRNLFLHTFKLSGLPYRGLKFSDGTRRSGYRRVVILSSSSTRAEEAEKRLSLFFGRVRVLDGGDGSLNITYLNPDWKLIDTLRK